MYAKVDQIVDPNNLLHNINEVHCRVLAKLFCNYNYSFVRRTIKVYSPSAVSPEDVTYATASTTLDGMNVLKEDYCMVRLDG